MDPSPSQLAPPQPPRISRRIRISSSLAVGIPLLLVLLALTIFRTFGEHMEHAEMAVSDIQVAVEYPSRLRETMRSAIRIEIHNTGAAAITGATLEFDPRYLDQFGELTFTPAAERAGVVALPELPPGNVHRILVELRAVKLGRHSGTMTIRLPDDRQRTVELHTFTFP